MFTFTPIKMDVETVTQHAAERGFALSMTRYGEFAIRRMYNGQPVGMATLTLSLSDALRSIDSAIEHAKRSSFGQLWNLDFSQ